MIISLSRHWNLFLGRRESWLSSMTGIARCTEEHYHDGERVTVGGLITGVRIRSTKKGSAWRPLCWKI